MNINRDFYANHMFVVINNNACCIVDGIFDMIECKIVNINFNTFC